MNFTKTTSTSASLVEITLEQGQQVKLETGAMVYKDTSISLEGKTNGGFFQAMGKSLLAGENFFTTTATATSHGKIALAPRGFGNIGHYNTASGNWYITDGAFLACDMTVDYSTTRQKGMSKGLLGATGGFFILKTSGIGDFLVNGFGDLVEIELDGSKPFQVDTGHVVCWEESLDYKIEVASGFFGFKTGEGLLNTFTGVGKVVIQTRQIEGFAEMMIPFMPQQRR